MRLRTVFAVLFLTAAGAVTAAGDGKPASSKQQPASTTTASSATSHSPVVHTNNGAVRGRIIRAANGRYTQEFLNIPYAQPPVDALRFRPPQPVKNWSSERDGTRLGKACVQSSRMFDKLFPNAKFHLGATPLSISEDCLTINVHTPSSAHEMDDRADTGSLPVLVWIHGGGFQMGSNNLNFYNASIMASEINAVVAVINYRLGPFGFFTLDGVEGVSGNQGLLDQTLAIKWVRDNAKHFGGDPEQITLFGESAGAASVHYHVLSPLSRDLFARSIMQSGSATGFWAYHTPEQARQSSRAVAAVAGCGDGSSKTGDPKVFACFQSKTTEELLAADEQIQETTSMNMKPTSDGYFLIKSPAEMLKVGDFKQAPAMIGTTANESMLLLSIFFTDLRAKVPDVRLSQTAFDDMLYNMTIFVGNASRDAIKFMYRDWNVPAEDEEAMGAERWRMLNSVMDDLFMTKGMIETLDAYLAAKVPIYRYRLDQISKVNIWGYNFNAALHCDDIPYVFGIPLNPLYGYPKEEIELSRQVLHAISGFARTGNPNLHSIGDQTGKKSTDADNWKPYAGNMEYFTFDAANYGKIQTAPERWRVEFWHRAVPYLSELEKRAGISAARAAAAKEPTMTKKDPKPKVEL